MPAATVDILIREKGAAAVKREVKGIQSSFKDLGGVAKSLIAPIAGIFSIGMLVRAGQETMAFRKRLEQVGIKAGLTAQATAALEGQIDKLSTSVGVADDKILNYIQGVVKAGGSMTVATDSMEAAAKTAEILGIEMDALAPTAAAMANKFDISGKAATDAFAVLIEQSKIGKMAVEDLAEIAPKAISLAAATGTTGIEGLRDMGAMLQLIYSGTQDAGTAMLAFRMMTAKMVDAGTEKKLRKLGVSMRDVKTGKLRSMGDIFVDVLAKSKGDLTRLEDIFGARGLMGISEFKRLYDQAGGSVEGVTQELDKFRDVTADASTLAKDFGRIEDTSAKKIEKARTQLAEALEAAALTPETLKAVGEALGNLAISATALAETLGFAKTWWEEKTGGAGEKGKEKRMQYAAGVAGAVMGGWAGPMGSAAGFKGGMELMEWMQGKWKGAPGTRAEMNAPAAESERIAGKLFAQPQSMNVPGGQVQGEMADVIAGIFGRPQEFTVNVNVLNAAGAEVQVQSSSGGKVKPGVGAGL